MEGVNTVAISVVYMTHYEMSSDSRRKKMSVVNKKKFGPQLNLQTRDYPLLVVRNSLFNTFVSTQHKYIQAVSSISNLRICRNVLTEGPK
jgi:hypothetical protein